MAKLKEYHDPKIYNLSKLRHIRFPHRERSIVYEILRQEIIRSVNDETIVLKNLESILWSQSFLVGRHLHIRIDSMDGLLSRFRLQPSTRAKSGAEGLLNRLCLH